MVLRSVAAAALAAGVAWGAGAACAETVRAPEQGTPAVVVEAPAGWAMEREPTGFALSKGQRLALTAEILPTRPGDKLTDVILAEFEAMGCKPIGAARPDRLNDQPGALHSCAVRGASNEPLGFVVIFVTRLDATHVGAVAQMHGEVRPDAGNQLEQLFRSVRFVTVR